MYKFNLKLTYYIIMMTWLVLISANSNAEESTALKTANSEKIGVCEKLNGEGDSWVDDLHTFLSIQFCEPAVWFDSFFSDERIDEEVRPGTRLRWQNDYVVTEGGVWQYTSNVRASFKLPKIKKNINLIFESDEEERLDDLVPGTKEEVKADLGLLSEIVKSERSKLTVRVKLSPSITFRYRYQLPLSETFTTRYTQEWYRRDSMDGTLSRIDFEKKINDHFFLRQSNSVMRSESYQGEKWFASLALYQHLTDKSALSYESSVNGLTIPERYTANTRFGIRYRNNFYRRWLFYEVVPAMNWNKLLITDEREKVWEVLFRLEVNFVNL